MKPRHLYRKLKFTLWIPLKITRKPHSSSASISDLFPLRNDYDWETYFELLDVTGLISGNNSRSSEKKALFVFYDKDGSLLGEKLENISSSGRTTIHLDENFDPRTKFASSFAVFHDSKSLASDIGSSFIAERGYTGYAHRNSGMRGYVHGNLDALAYENGIVEPLGNSGLLSRVYYVQHPLRGPARYEFFISNPTSRTVKVKIELRLSNEDWQCVEKLVIPSKGSRVFQINKTEKSPSFLRIRSRLYLGRPVVFRIMDRGFDVFHG